MWCNHHHSYRALVDTDVLAVFVMKTCAVGRGVDHAHQAVSVERTVVQDVFHKLNCSRSLVPEDNVTALAHRTREYPMFTNALIQSAVTRFVATRGLASLRAQLLLPVPFNNLMLSDVRQ